MGLRPLVKGEGKTSALSRDHVIHVDTSGLLTITGGKWTTYRHMAEDCVDHAITLGRLRDEPCPTRNLHIHGYVERWKRRCTKGIARRLRLRCGGDSRSCYRTPALATQLHPALPYIAAEVVWARARGDGAHAWKMCWRGARARCS